MRREVCLKVEFAHLYPALTPGHWYTAAAVDGLVRGTRIVTEGEHVEFVDRILVEEHFEFRGGGPRRGVWMGQRTRHHDRHGALAGAH
ncbi:MAG TPA: hypothetical protein VG692_06055 [Gemmatimonadales bacterium]|nr:hypothetical protein [Gemmatimonadales bacterium]